MPHRILHVNIRYWPVVSGAEIHLQAYAERQAAEGFDVTVFTTDALDLAYLWDHRKARISRESEVHNGVRIERFPIRHLPPPGIGFRAARRLLAEIDRVPGTGGLLARLCLAAPFVPGLRSALDESAGRFDVVHGMNIALEALLFPARDHARNAGAPFLMSPLTHLGESAGGSVRRYYTMQHQVGLVCSADGVLIQTPTEARFYVDRGLNEARLWTGGAGVDPDAVIGGDGNAFRARHDLPGPLVGFLGTLAFDKGADHAVRAMETHWARGGVARLVMAGAMTDPFATFLGTLPETTRQRIVVLPSASDDEKRGLLAAIDLLVLPSRTDSFGIVFLEAWLNGKVVVAADAGGVGDVVEHERSGLVVPFGDVDAIEHAIARLLSDAGLRARMAQHGARRVRERHTWDRVYERVRPAFMRSGHESLAIARREARGDH